MFKTRSIIIVLLVILSTIVTLPAIALTGPGDGPVPVAEAPPTSTDRAVLIELVTAGWCPNCPNADGALLEMEEAYGRDQLVILAYHRNDQLSNDGGDARQAFYDDPYQPDVFVDGLAEVVGNKGSVTANRAAYEVEVDARLAEPSPLALTAEGYTDTTTGEGVAYVNVTALSDPGLSDLRLHVVVFEDDFGPWNGGNGVTTHDWLTRQLLTGNDGQALTLEVGSEQSFSFTYDASDYAQDLDQVGVIAFVQSAGATTEVLQAAYVKEHMASPVNNLPEFASPRVTPEEGNTSTTFRYEIGYRDDDGDAPVKAQVVIDGFAYDLQTDHPSGPFTEWTGYYHETPLTVGDDHTFRFVFSDGKAELRIPDPTQGPELFTGPVVDPPTSAPTLALPSLEPAEGDALTLRTFSVVYTDGEGDAPVTAQVVIDGVSHEMTGQGTGYRLGVTYAYSTTLAPGEHEYHFSFDDGIHGVRLPANGSTTGSVVDELQRIVVLASHAEDGVVSEVEQVTLGFDDTDVPEGLVTTLSWVSDLDGALGTGNEVTFSLSEGTHTLMLEVTTSTGTEHSQTITLVSLAAMPEPVVDQVTVTPEVPTEGDVVAIDVRVLNEGDAVAEPQEVELRDAASEVLANASTVDALAPGASTTVTLSWTAVEGTHALTVRVGEDEYSLPLLVEENFAPIIDASIEGDDTSFPEGEAISFSVQVSDVENDEVTYLWDFDDGATSNETSPTHKYSKPGKYTVTVTVTDARGAESTDSLEVEVTESAVPGLAAFTILLVVLVSALVAIVLRRR